VSSRARGAASRAQRASRLDALADANGLILGLAFDHRDSLDALLRGLGRSIDRDAIRRLKRDVVREIAPLATTVMIDHDYGRLALSERVVPRDVALVMPLEAQGYAQLGDERVTTLMSDFSPRAAADRGATACKLLLPMRPDRLVFTKRQLDVAYAAAQATKAAGLVFVLEPQVYRLSSESAAAFGSEYRDMVIAATELVASIRPDLLKLPFPTLDDPAGPGADDRARIACGYVAPATAGVPWVVYGGGAGEAAFAWQLRHAMRAGACGFLVGRTVWRDALTADDVSATARHVCAPRFASFVALARKKRQPSALTPPAAPASRGRTAPASR
jgi:tagatose 1,6-diphosphate aldolase